MGEQLTENRSDSKFNFGVEALMNVSRLLKAQTDIALLGVENANLSRGKAQHMRIDIAKQILLASSPFLDNEQRIKIKERLSRLKGSYTIQYSDVGKIKSKEELFDSSIETELMDIIEEIELKMDEYGEFFNPKKGEKRLF